MPRTGRLAAVRAHERPRPAGYPRRLAEDAPGIFISRQESGLRPLALSRSEIQEIRESNHARPIDGTQFWAVMTIDDATRRRFVRRLLGFIGCHDGTVAQAIRALGLTDAPRGFRLLSV